MNLPNPNQCPICKLDDSNHINTQNGSICYNNYQHYSWDRHTKFITLRINNYIIDWFYGGYRAKELRIYHYSFDKGWIVFEDMEIDFKDFDPEEFLKRLLDLSFYI